MRAGFQKDFTMAVIVSLLLHGVLVMVIMAVPRWCIHIAEKPEVMTVSLHTFSRPAANALSHVRPAGTRIVRASRHEVVSTVHMAQLDKVSVPDETEMVLHDDNNVHEGMGVPSFMSGVDGVTPDNPGDWGAGFEPPRYYRHPEPLYPMLARRRGFEGVTLLAVTVGVDGTVASLSVKESSGYDVLDNAALSAVKMWLFEPARERGVPVSCQVDVPVRFALREG